MRRIFKGQRVRYDLNHKDLNRGFIEKHGDTAVAIEDQTSDRVRVKLDKTGIVDNCRRSFLIILSIESEAEEL